MRIRKGLVKRIHVSQVNLRANRKDGGSRPEFTVQTSDGPMKGRSVKINGPAELISRPNKPLKCGARVWLETRAEVEVL